MCVFFFQQKAFLIIHWINNLGIVAPIFFLFLYCFATLFFLPTMVLTLAGGAIFGPVLGTFFNLLGATIGAGCAFCISRYLIFDWLKTKENARISKLIKGVENRGWQFVALLRIVPIIPFNIVNYGLGLTGIKFSHYMLTTVIFLIPTEIISTYCGYAGMDMLINTGLLYKRFSLLAFLILSFILIVIQFWKKK
ncbi:TVP38/TMEM64 family protein [Legionella londiniensis]|nr:VTT domain-containing protein [Legionella londiniensis]